MATPFSLFWLSVDLAPDCADQADGQWIRDPEEDGEEDLRRVARPFAREQPGEGGGVVEPVGHHLGGPRLDGFWRGRGKECT